ncbi:hypothetical protein D3C74_431800 [compost metagenome]
MTHFTLTGRYAGQTYCGQPRNDNDEYIHIKSEQSPIMQKLLNGEDELCPCCKAAYLESFEEDE